MIHTAEQLTPHDTTPSDLALFIQNLVLALEEVPTISDKQKKACQKEISRQLLLGKQNKRKKPLISTEKHPQPADDQSPLLYFNITYATILSFLSTMKETELSEATPIMLDLVDDEGKIVRNATIVYGEALKLIQIINLAGVGFCFASVKISDDSSDQQQQSYYRIKITADAYINTSSK